MDEATTDAVRALREAAWIMENGGFDKHLFLGGAHATFALLNVYGDESLMRDEWLMPDWVSFIPPSPLACLFAADVLENP